MKKYTGYVRVDLKVAPSVFAEDALDAEEKIYEMTLEELLEIIVDISGVDVYSVSTSY